MLWKLLDHRFPQKETTDIMGEILGEVFNLKAKPNETLKAWVARATELFDRCERKTKVTFPQEARGWILLHRAGMTKEQQAVILACAQGQLEREKICIATRSCYPDLVCQGNKAIPAHLVEEHPSAEVDLSEDPGPEIEFKDVELLLIGHRGFYF